MNKMNEFNELYKPVNQHLLYSTLFDLLNLNSDTKNLNTSQQNVKKQYIELISQLTNAPIITDEEFINKVNEISKIGTIIICYIRNTDIIIVGSGTIIYEPKIIHGGKSVGHIEDIIVDKNYRNKGIAKNILNMLVNLAKNICYKVILDCKEELVDFYSKNGFNKNGIQMAKYF
jgi:glucosamine-phosphate N-acetyltransferase